MGRSTDYEVRLRGRELEGCLEGLAADVVPVAVARCKLAVITRIWSWSLHVHETLLLENLARLRRLVVEHDVCPEGLDELDLLVGPRRCDDSEAFGLRDLYHGAAIRSVGSYVHEGVTSARLTLQRVLAKQVSMRMET